MRIGPPVPALTAVPGMAAVAELAASAGTPSGA